MLTNNPGKYFSIFLLFFIVLYFDGGSSTFSALWKLPVFIYMILYIIQSKRQRLPQYVKMSYLWGIKNFMNLDTLTRYVFDNISYGVKFLIPAVCYDFFSRKCKRQDQLFQVGLIISQYVILTSIPFLLGILGSPGGSLEYEGIQSFSGIFSGQHTFAVTTSMATFFIMFYILHERPKRTDLFFNIVLFLIATIAIYKAFVRTGWVMFALGNFFVFYFHLSGSIIKRSIKLLPLLVILTFALFSFYQSNERLNNRINDRLEDGYQAEAGSGRNLFRAISLAYWLEGDVVEKTFGYGIESLKDNMDKKIGMRLYSHNGFVDALTGNGIIGLFLLVFFILGGFIYIFKNRKSLYFSLALSCMISWMLYQAFQGGSFVMMDVIFAIGLALVDKRYRLHLKK